LWSGVLYLTDFISIKSLIDVHFVGEASDDGTKRYICPSCKKGLNSVGKQLGECEMLLVIVRCFY
jgi:hypothetical protein